MSVLDALHFTLAEKIKAVGGAHLLTAESLNTLLNAAGITAAQQATMAQDDAAIALVRTASGGALPNEVLTILAHNTVAFCMAVMRNNAFTRWVIDDPGALVRIIAAVVTMDIGSRAVRTPLDHPLGAWAYAALQQASPRGSPVRIRMMGGSVPPTAWSTCSAPRS